MADKLTAAFQEYETKAGKDEADFASFAAGFTAAAVSMRARAMGTVDVALKGAPTAAGTLNSIKNAIGQLPDIPQE